MAAKSTISLGIEVTGGKAFQAELKACDAESKALTAELTRLSQSSSLLDKGLTGAAQKFATFGQSLQVNKEKLEALRNALPQAKDALAQLSQELERAKASGDSKAIESATIAYEKQRQTVAGLQQNMSQARQAIDQTKQSLQQMVTGAIATGFNNLKNVASNLAQGFVAVGKAAAEAANAIIDKMNKAVIGITASATAVVVGLGKVGIEYNNQMEGYITNFTTLLGSTEAAAKKVQEIKEMAAKTPFGMEDLAQATQTLLSFGVEADKTTPILKALGDVSLGNKEKFSSLALAFGQVSSAGKLTGQDLNQMINAGFNPLNEISKRTGESMEQLRDRMSKGAISAKEVEQAFMDATSAGGQFYNGMEAASKTTEGLISTLKDNAKALVGQVFEPISNSIKNDLLPAALGYLQQLTDAFTKGGLQGLIKAVGDVIDGITREVQTKAPKVIQEAFEVINQVINRLTQSMPQLVKVGQEIIDNVISGLRATLPKLGPIAAEIAPLIVKTVFSYKGTLLNSGIEIISSIVSGLAKEMPSIMKTISQGLDDFLKTIDRELPQILKAGGEIIESLIKGLLMNTDKVTKAIADITTALINWISDNLGLLIDAGIKIIGALVQGIINSLSNVNSAVTLIIAAIVAIKGPLIGAMVAIGVNVVKAIWEGIKSVANWLSQQVTGFFSNVINDVKNFLGIHSPSSVFMDIGENIGLGLAEGIRNTAGIVQAAMDYITPTAGNITMGMDTMSVASRVAAADGASVPWFDNRPIILTLNDRELGRAVRGYV